MTHAWERLPDEPFKAYEAFLLYLNNPEDRELTSPRFGEKYSYEIYALRRWRHNYRWAERAEAYDRYMEEEIKARQNNMIDASIYHYLEELDKQARILMVSFGIYAQKLKEGGIEQLQKLSLADAHEQMLQDLEALTKILKLRKEYLELTPEMRNEPKDRININIVPASPQKIEVETEASEAGEVRKQESIDVD